MAVMAGHARGAFCAVDLVSSMPIKARGAKLSIGQSFSLSSRTFCSWRAGFSW